MTKILEIIDKLRELSAQGRITWKPTVNEDTFMAALENTSVVMTRTELPDMRLTYSLSILNELGLEVVRHYSHESELAESEALESIYETARHSAVEAHLDNVLVELNRL